MKAGSVTAANAMWYLPDVTQDAREEMALSTARELDRFLESVERSAFRIARYAVRDTDEALDIVQDAMMQLVRHYGGKAEEELKALFYRILKNRIHDWQRRRAVRSKVIAWFGAGHGGDTELDPVEHAPDQSIPVPSHQAMLDESMAALDVAIEALPGRQQQALLLRLYEGLGVAETAQALGCSEGSVKTHYSRAVHRLRDKLGDFMP